MATIAAITGADDRAPAQKAPMPLLAAQTIALTAPAPMAVIATWGTRGVAAREASDPGPNAAAQPVHTTSEPASNAATPGCPFSSNGIGSAAIAQPASRDAAAFMRRLATA